MEILLWFAIFYVWHVFGVTVGYHRLLAHRSFQCPKLVEYFLVIGGYLAFESSPIWWATIHRAHHRYTDTELDPHSPRYGNGKAYCGWIFGKRYPEHLDPKIQAPDLVNDPLYSLLERNNNWHTSHLTNTAIGFGSRLIIWALFGWKIALASVLAGLVVQQVPFMVNLFCHKPKLGYQNFATADDSVNVWWLVLITLGDNWHNNHHAYPGCARAGMRWFELDFSWLLVKTLSFCGLASHINDRFSLTDARFALRAEPAATQAQAAAIPEITTQAAMAAQATIAATMPVQGTVPVHAARTAQQEAQSTLAGKGSR